MKWKAMNIGLAIVVATPLAWADASVDEYRAMLADKDANPGILVIERGEALFKTPGGPKNSSLEKCDFGLGAGNLKGAFAQLPRYFKDTGLVQDVESRLMTCMVKLQGLNEADIKAKPFSDQRNNEDNTNIEALAAYVAAQSNGMKFNISLKHAKEKETLAVGEAIYWRRYGPMDFSCATCHAADGKRIRLQALVNAYNKADIQSTMTKWPTYRVSHGVVRTMEHRMWDCNWQMRAPDIGYGSPAAIALISFLTHQAEGGIIDVPGLKR